MGGRTIAIRRFWAADAPEAARLHAQSFAPPWSAEDFIAQSQRADRVMSAAVSREPHLDGIAVSRLVAGEADLLTIVVSREMRGIGLGGALLGRHLSALTSVGATTVFLEVGVGNAAARALYARNGFTIVGTRKGYYAASGRPEDALVLRLDLA